MFKVFVSYSTNDLNDVSSLQRAISGTGVEVFVAEHSVSASERLSEKISTAIAGCDLFILLWSKNAKGSEWVSQEIGKAHSLNKKILPLILTEGLHLPGFISDLKYIAVYRDPVSSIQEAQRIVFEGYKFKMEELARQKQNEGLMLLGLGALVFWAINQK